MVKKICFNLLCLFLITPAVFAWHALAIDTTSIRSLIDSSNFYTYSKAEKSIDFARQALQLAEEKKAPNHEAEALMSLAKAFYIKGEYDLSLQYGTRLYTLSQQIGYGRGKAFALNNRGLIFLSQENHKAALREFNAALQVNKSLNMLKPQASNYFNIALCYMELKELNEAEKALNESIMICKAAKDSTVFIMAINRLGDIAYQRKQYGRSLQFFKTALQQNTQKNDWEFTFSYTGMALAEFEAGLYDAAIKNAQKGLDHAKKLGAYWDIHRASKILYEAYAATKNYKLAFEYQKLNALYGDSLYNEKKEKEINKLMLKQKQVENEDLQHKLEIRQQRILFNQLIIFVVGIVVVLLTAILLVIYRKNMQVRTLNEELIKRNANMALQRDQIEQQNVELANLNHSKDQLFSVIGHDLRSPIVSIIQTVDLLRSDDLSAAETRLILDSFFEKLTATATMLDNLLLWVQGQKKEIRTDKSHFLLPSLMDQLLMVLNFQAKEKNISIQHEPLEGVRVYADVNHVRIIFQNLISNAIKFTPAGGRIFIHYFVDEVKSGVVLRDTGVGIPKDKIPLLFRVMGKDISTYGTAHEKGIGIGLMLVKKYADENEAGIVVNSTAEGTEFIVVFNRSVPA